MDEAFIIVSVISGIFGILGLELLTHNWFRKEKFKIQAFNLKKQNELQLKKMAKELGLSSNIAPSKALSLTGAPGSLDINSILALLQTLKPEHIQLIRDLIGGAPAPAPMEMEGGEEYLEEGTGDLKTDLVSLAMKHPKEATELIQGILSKIPQLSGGGAGGESGGGASSGWI